MPGLVDEYTQQHRAWLAHAEELIRLRAQVRSAAEDEAAEIITRARRDIRRILTDARHNLRVLTSQLQAAVDARNLPADEPAARALAAELGADERAAQPHASLRTPDLTGNSRHHIRAVIDEARAEIDALLLEAPLAGQTHQGPYLAADRDAPSGSPDAHEKDHGEVRDPEILDVSSHLDWLPDPGPAVRTADATRLEATVASLEDLASSPPQFEPLDDRGAFRSGVFATSETAYADEPKPATGRRRVVVAAAMFVAVAGEIWGLRPGGGASPHPTTTATIEVPESLPLPTPTTLPPAMQPLTLIFEARRAAWIRATVDEQEEAGRIYRVGETRQIVGAARVAIRTGDAGAVYVSVNGSRFAPLGADGAVVTEQFPRSDRALTQTPTTIPRVEAEAKPVVLPVPVFAPDVEKADGPVSLPPTPVATMPAPTPTPTPTATPTPAVPIVPAGGGLAVSSTDRSVAPTDLVLAGQQWLDAYHRRDREAMERIGSQSVKVSDERSVLERFSLAQSGVRRDFDQVELELTGDTALLTGRITERLEGGAAAPPPLVSRVSQIWVRRTGRWHLADVRIVGEQRLNQLVR